jgi:hypothetical protein
VCETPSDFEPLPSLGPLGDHPHLRPGRAQKAILDRAYSQGCWTVGNKDIIQPDLEGQRHDQKTAHKAQERAKQDGHDVELWQHDRKIATFTRNQ